MMRWGRVDPGSGARVSSRTQPGQQILVELDPDQLARVVAWSVDPPGLADTGLAGLCCVHSEPRRPAPSSQAPGTRTPCKVSSSGVEPSSPFHSEANPGRYSRSTAAKLAFTSSWDSTEMPPSHARQMIV